MTALSLATSPLASLRRIRSSYLPPPELKVSEFSDAHIIVTSGPLTGTKWQTAFAPYQRGILDAFHERGVQTVVVMGSSQWGKTACAVNIVAYHMAHDPCSILVVEPTVEPMAKDFAKNRLDPIIRATPQLADVVDKKRSKDASNTTLAKTFKGGAIAIGGANSASSLASRSVRLLVLDEVDRYPPELPGEGSTLAIAMKRTTAYKRKRRILMLSSPTLKGAAIHTWHERGDQRRYFVPCPHCGELFVYQWRQIRWAKDEHGKHLPETARLHCPGCDYGLDDAERVAVLEHGEWQPTAPNRTDKSVVSFHIWEAYSPLSSLQEIVTGFLNARTAQKRGDKSEMHTWTNTTLGDPIEPEQGEGPDEQTLLSRRKDWPDTFDVPEFACCLTAGVDTQDDRLEVLIVGWGPGEESCFVDRHTLPGDPDGPEAWQMLDELLDRPYQHELGASLMVHSTCIDSAGHKTSSVYAYAERRSARRVYATIGRDGQRPIVSSPSPKRWGIGERQVPLYTLGVDAAKTLIVGRLNLSDPGPGYIHFPVRDWCDDEFVAQLTSERLVTKWDKGLPVQVWKKIRPRNEAFDCSVYALAALRLLNPKLTAMQQILRESASARVLGAPMPSRVRPPSRRVGRSSYLGR